MIYCVTCNKAIVYQTCLFVLKRSETVSSQIALNAPFHHCANVWSETTDIFSVGIMLVFLVEGGATGEPKHAHPLALKDWLLKVYLRLLHLNKTMTIYFGYSGCKFNLPIYREFGYDRETACWVMCVQNMNWGKIVFEIKPDLFQYQLNICKKKKNTL